MARRTTGAALVGLVLSMSPVTWAGTWDEVGDAPAWPADPTWQLTDGFGPLTAISGTTSLALGDLVDAYGIRITDAADFYATTSDLTDPNGTASFDTRLWLFNVDGTPVLGNDDAPGDASLHSLLTAPQNYPGTVAPTANGIMLTPGKYVLIIGGFGIDPEDANNIDMVGPFLVGSFEDLHGPNPPAGPFDHWENFGSEQTGTYTIALNGATFIVPAPGVGTLVVLGFTGFLGRRRRRQVFA